MSEFIIGRNFKIDPPNDSPTRPSKIEQPIADSREQAFFRSPDSPCVGSIMRAPSSFMHKPAVPLLLFERKQDPKPRAGDSARCKLSSKNFVPHVSVFSFPPRLGCSSPARRTPDHRGSRPTVICPFDSSCCRLCWSNQTFVVFPSKRGGLLLRFSRPLPL